MKPFNAAQGPMQDGGGPTNITKEQVEKAVMDALNSLYGPDAEEADESKEDPEVDAVMAQVAPKKPQY